MFSCDFLRLNNQSAVEKPKREVNKRGKKKKQTKRNIMCATWADL